MSSPGTVIAHADYTVLCTAPNGAIAGHPHGLYDFDTRVCSRYRLTIDGSEPELVASGQADADSWWAVLRAPRGGRDADGPSLPQDVVEVRVTRVIDSGMVETIELTNHAMTPWIGRVGVELAADFADTAELALNRIPDRAVPGRWIDAERRVELTHREEGDGRCVERALGVALCSPQPAGWSDGALTLEVELEPRGSSTITLAFESLVDGVWRRPDRAGPARRAPERSTWRATRPVVEGSPTLEAVFDRAADDLFDLRNRTLEERFLASTGRPAWLVNAGVPMFTGAFGRDLLTVGWQAGLVGPAFVRGALEIAARTQADEADAERDAEPGRIIHEIRRGPLADLGRNARDTYYGTQTAPALFVITLAEAWRWTGEIGLLERYLPAAEAALAWTERADDENGDGFTDSVTHAEGGLKNQGWKDSPEAIRYPDGRLVDNPVATVEEQALRFVAIRRMAEILAALGRDREADDHVAAADRLARRWHKSFWMPDERFHALALDGDRRPVTTIASNPGHGLTAGIVPYVAAGLVADRLLSDELFTGWGVRTLSDRHPSYNPFAYHLGSVWPVENASFVAGFRRYGLTEHLERLATAVLDAAAQSPQGRLPEALSGHARSDGDPPIPYPDANRPQAWSASAIVRIVQALLGIEPYAPLRVLALSDPRLPPGVSSLTLRRLRIGRAEVDLRFDRVDGDRVVVAPLRSEGPVTIVLDDPDDPSSGGRPWIERVPADAREAMPPELIRAARIACAPPPETS